MNRQVLAEPDAVLATKTWASLEDGTPLVTGEHRGKGIVSLFHVGADSRWSDLPMSGSFVEMLRRMVDMSGYTSKPGAGVASGASATGVSAGVVSAGVSAGVVSGAARGSAAQPPCWKPDCAKRRPKPWRRSI